MFALITYQATLMEYRVSTELPALLKHRTLAMKLAPPEPQLTTLQVSLPPPYAVTCTFPPDDAPPPSPENWTAYVPTPLLVMLVAPPDELNEYVALGV
jgi:hypothetical protein